MIRQAIAATALERGPGGGTWRELAALAGVGFGAAKHTVRNMASAGELVVLGVVEAPGSRRPLMRYAAAHLAADAPGPGAALDAVLRGWADF